MPKMPSWILTSAYRNNLYYKGTGKNKGKSSIVFTKIGMLRTYPSNNPPKTIREQKALNKKLRITKR